MKRSNLARSILLGGIVICILAVVAVLIVSRSGANRTTTSSAPRFTIYLADPVPSSYVGPITEYQFDVGKARVRITEDDIDEYIWATQTIVLKSTATLTWPKVSFFGAEPEHARFAIGIDGDLVCRGVVVNPGSALRIDSPVIYLFPAGLNEYDSQDKREWAGVRLVMASRTGFEIERSFPCETANNANAVKQLFSALGKLR